MPRVNDNVLGYRAITASKWLSGQVTVSAAFNSTAAITSAMAAIITIGHNGWVASTLAYQVYTRGYLGVSEQAVAASSSALDTITEWVIAGPTDIITTALPTTGYYCSWTTGAVIVNTTTAQNKQTVGVWMLTSTSLTAAKNVILTGLECEFTS